MWYHQPYLCIRVHSTYTYSCHAKKYPPCNFLMWHYWILFYKMKATHKMLPYVYALPADILMLTECIRYPFYTTSFNNNNTLHISRWVYARYYLTDSAICEVILLSLSWSCHLWGNPTICEVILLFVRKSCYKWGNPAFCKVILPSVG